jgi:hypothetical protein
MEDGGEEKSEKATLCGVDGMEEAADEAGEAGEAGEAEEAEEAEENIIAAINIVLETKPGGADSQKRDWEVRPHRKLVGLELVETKISGPELLAWLVSGTMSAHFYRCSD